MFNYIKANNIVLSYLCQVLADFKKNLSHLDSAINLQ